MSDNFQSYSSYVPHEEVFNTGPQLRVDSPVHRVAMSGGAVFESVEQATQRGNEGQINPAYGTDTWMATARTTDGRPVAEITGDSLVTIAGVQAKVSFFVAEGVLQKAPDGTFTEGTGTPDAVPMEGDYAPIPDHAMAQINQLLEPLPQAALEPILALAAGVATGRLTDAALIAQFATSARISPEDSAARLTVIKAVYQAQTDTALQTRHGIGEADRADFYEYCRTHQRGAMGDAISRQMHAGDVSGWNPLAAQWLSVTAPSLEAIKADGRIPVRGQEIFVGGHWMSAKAAARANLI